MVRLDEGRFPALELNNRRLSVKNSFCRKNGIYTRSVPDRIHFLRAPPLRRIVSWALLEFLPLAIQRVACDTDRN